MLNISTKDRLEYPYILNKNSINYNLFKYIEVRNSILTFYLYMLCSYYLSINSDIFKYMNRAIIKERKNKVIYIEDDKCFKVFEEGYNVGHILNEALNQARVQDTDLKNPAF